MADPLLGLEVDRLTAEPGGQARVSVTVSNPGQRVEGYRLEVVGEGVSGWAEVVPPEVNVYPKEEATAVVVISPPPGGAAPSGSWPFGVRARSLVDPSASAVIEGAVEVGKVFGLQAKLVPVTSSGRWRGRHVLHVSNWGNSTARLRLVPSNPDAALGFLIRPPVLELPVGSQATARIWVRGRRPFLRGSNVRVPFAVVAERADVPTAPTTTPTAAPAISTADRPVVDGALNQRPILSRAVVTLGALALVLVVGGAVWAARQPPAVGSADYVDTVAPDRPGRVTAVATGPTTVNVTWDAVPRVKSWEVQALRGPSGPVFQVLPAEGAQTSTTVEALPATTEICFRVRALGFGLDGPPSEAACDRTLEVTPSAAPSSLEPLPPPGGTPTPAPTTAPPPPVSVPAASSPAISPAPVSAPPVSAPPAPPGSTAAAPSVSPAPSGSGASAPPSVPPPGVSASPGTSSPAGGGSSAPAPTAPLTGRWVAAALYNFAPDPTAELTQKTMTGLRAAGLQPVLIYSGDPQFAELQPTGWGPAVPSWMVVVGPYGTAPEAQAVCPQVLAVSFMCRVIQPDPS